MSALLRIWPLLLTIPLNFNVGDAPHERLAVLGLSCLTVATGLLYYLMTQDATPKSKRPRLGTLR